eukprot:scaffold30627_cov19-Prasinocladus_malaysianus.AAC.1
MSRRRERGDAVSALGGSVAANEGPRDPPRQAVRGAQVLRHVRLGASLAERSIFRMSLGLEWWLRFMFSHPYF